MEFREPSLLKLRDWIPFEKLDWERLSINPAAINLLENNLDKVNWYNLEANPAAIHLIKVNINKFSRKIKDQIIFDFTQLFSNPEIFEYDYQLIKETNKQINKEICEWQWQEDTY